MIFVYILGKVEAGTEAGVLDKLKNVNQVRKASLTYGVYDLCVEAQFKNMEELDEFLIDVVRKIQGIKDTVTLITSRAVFPKPAHAMSFG
jgi:DNA-binding Lrp family transcriptional regulator